jgi:hypothetical protein
MNKETVLGVVRHILTFGGGALVVKGYTDEAGLEEAVGAIVALIGFAWSIKIKIKEKKNETAAE